MGTHDNLHWQMPPTYIYTPHTLPCDMQQKIYLHNYASIVLYNILYIIYITSIQIITNDMVPHKLCTKYWMSLFIWHKKVLLQKKKHNSFFLKLSHTNLFKTRKWTKMNNLCPCSKDNNFSIISNCKVL